MENVTEMRVVDRDDIPDGYVVVEWPNSQNYMDEDWFNEEAQLINAGELYEIHGDAAYLIPTRRYTGTGG